MRRVRSVVFCILAAGLIAGGCAAKKTGVQLSEKTTTSMEDVQKSLQQASGQIDATNAALTDVIRSGQSGARPEDVRKSFDVYSANVKKMDKTAQLVNKHIDQMASRGNDYFQEWSKSGGTYTDPQMQKLSAQERDRLTRSFADITTASAGMRGSLNAYLSEIKQIQTYLSNDLTATGLAAINPVAQAAARDGAELKRSFSPVQTALDRARAEMMPGGTAAGGGAAPGQQPQQNQIVPQNTQPQTLPPQNQQLPKLQPQPDQRRGQQTL